MAVMKQIVFLMVVVLVTACGGGAGLSVKKELSKGDYIVYYKSKSQVVKDFSIRRSGQHTVKLKEKDLWKDQNGNIMRNRKDYHIIDPEFKGCVGSFSWVMSYKGTF